MAVSRREGVIVRADIEAMFRRVRDTLRPLGVEVWHVPPWP